MRGMWGKLVKELLSTLTIDERLGAMLELEDAIPDKFAQLVADAFALVEWIVYESGNVIVSIFANLLTLS